MRRACLGKIVFLLAFLLVDCGTAVSETVSANLRKSSEFKPIKARVVKKMPLPAGYHEGLFYDGKSMWVANGKGGRIWVVDAYSGEIISEIDPIASFTEGIDRLPDGAYLVTDWDAMKLYRARLDGTGLLADGQVSFAPEHPAGVALAGERVFVVTWHRSVVGTRFYLIELTTDLKVRRKVALRRIQEPAHLAWDGRNLWMTSWYEDRVYRIDIDKMEATAYFKSPAELTTGIAWDGSHLWLTGTYSDLYQVELSDKKMDPVGLPLVYNNDMKLTVTSSAFKDGEMMPARYGWRSENVSPPLEWSGVPAGTKSVAVISDDPDAPAGTWVHWVIFNIPPSEKGLAEGVAKDKVLANGAVQGINDSDGIGFDGPAPPSGIHRYYFKVYALDSMLDAKAGVTKAELLRAMKGHVLAEGELMGKFRKD